MSITKKLTSWLALTGMLVVTAFAGSSATAATMIPGIPDAGTPAFTHIVKLSANQGKWSARLNGGNKDFFLNTGHQILPGEAFKFNFDATFNKQTGVFEGGSMSIQGTLPGLNILDKFTVLMSADLTGFGTAGNLIGFNTANIVCNPALGLNCTTNESVIFVLNSVFGGDGLTKLTNATATAITTVPLPAAVWLFGSGLCFIAVTARRRIGRTTV